MTTTFSPDAERRIDLDWVRIIAFGLLIFYHVACFYWPGTPHNQALSPRGIPWLIVPMLALNPWRLLILFIVSGAATRFMADKMTPGALFRLRNARLTPPLWFVTLVFAPPMGFVAARQWGLFQGSPLDYLGFYFTHICPGGQCSIGFNYGHLWFVLYLFAYTVVLIGPLALSTGALQALQRGLERTLSGWGLIIWPAAYLALARMALGGIPQSMNFVWDWYSHAIYFAGFLFGFLVAKSPTVWTRLMHLRALTLMGALATYGLLIIGAIETMGADFNWGAAHVAAQGHATADPKLAAAIAGLLFGLDQWLWIAAAFGFAHRYLAQADGPARRYLTDAIFPFYIIHELTILVGGYYLVKLHLDLGLEAAVLIGGTALSCFATYEIVRRISWLRPLFGLKRAVTANPLYDDKSAVSPQTSPIGGEA